MKKPREFTFNQKLIWRFVAMPEVRGKSFWGIEGRMASKLAKLYDKDFLLQMELPAGYKVSSLMWFLAPEGRHYLSQQYFEYKARISNPVLKQEQVVLEESRVVEEVKIQPRKPKTVQDFLNYGKKN